MSDAEKNGKRTVLKLVFPFEPRPKQSTKFFRRGNFVGTYQPVEVTSYKAQIAYSFIEQVGGGFKPIESPIFISRLWYIFPTLKDISKKDMARVEAWENRSFDKGTFPEPVYKAGGKLDLTDNLSKGFIDALTGLLWKDDGQIVVVNDMMKCYGIKPRTELWVEVLG